MTDIDQWAADLASFPITGWDPKARRYVNIPLISEIIKGSLYVGGCEPYLDLPEFIDHVVSMYPWGKYSLNENQTRDEFSMYDAEGDVDVVMLEAAVQSVLTALEQRKTVLIHCQAGINRSNLVAAIVLIRWALITPDEAIEMLREKRDPYILSNSDFEAYVRAYRG